MSTESTDSAETPDSDTPVLSLRDVEVHFTSQRMFGLLRDETIRAVDGVSLDIYENDVIALVGESGCGKTTLGKTAIGLQQPTGGEVLYRGHDISELKRKKSGLFSREGDVTFEDARRALQIIHQDPGNSLNANYTVLSNLEAPLKRWQPELSYADRRQRILGFLEYVGMSPAEDYSERYPHQLSGGEQQRVALIRALLMNPEVILADEAVSALDVSLRIEIIDLMIEMQRQFETSYLFISHNMSNARYFAKQTDGRIGVMYLGKLVEIGPVDQVLDNPQHPYTKSLIWATPDLYTSNVEEPPLRTLDVPDSSNPPSGCRFHTRCPEAHEICAEVHPRDFRAGPDHVAACFRVEEDHEYWNSPHIEEESMEDIQRGYNDK